MVPPLAFPPEFFCAVFARLYPRSLCPLLRSPARIRVNPRMTSAFIPVPVRLCPPAPARPVVPLPDHPPWSHPLRSHPNSSVLCPPAYTRDLCARSPARKRVQLYPGKWNGRSCAGKEGRGGVWEAGGGLSVGQVPGSLDALVVHSSSPHLRRLMARSLGRIFIQL